MLKIKSVSEQETVGIAGAIATACPYPATILLSGNLGSGKTAFARGFINWFDHQLEVASPTFTICNIYDVKSIRIYHYDLYRIKNKRELFELGIDEAFESGICLIEWPSIAEDFLPVSMLEVSITDSHDARLFNSPGIGTNYRLPPPPAGGARGGHLSTGSTNPFPPLNPSPHVVGETSNIHPDRQTWGVTRFFELSFHGQWEDKENSIKDALIKYAA